MQPWDSGTDGWTDEGQTDRWTDRDRQMTGTNLNASYLIGIGQNSNHSLLHKTTDVAHETILPKYKAAQLEVTALNTTHYMCSKVYLNCRFCATFSSNMKPLVQQQQ